jgi:hypothetical protein
VDYRINDEVANPLSYIVETTGQNLPEYPVIFLYGGMILNRSKIVEVSSSLYENCLEVDLAYSRLLKDSLNNSTGTKVISNPSGEPLPRSLEGTISLNGNQTLQYVSGNGSNSQVALDILNSIQQSVSEGYSVPGYQVSSTVSGIESGIALYIKNQPKIAMHEFRKKLNQPQISRLFAVEKALLEYSLDKDFGEISLSWDAGSIEMPENPIERLDRIERALSSGLISYVQAVKELHGYVSDEEAISHIEKIQEQDEQYAKPQSVGKIKGLF